MSLMPGSFRPEEIVGADDGLGDAELAAAYAMAREIESALPSETIGPSAGFAARVMDAVAREPAPRGGGFLGVLIANPGLGGLLASTRAAWLVASRGAGRPAGTRGLALAYVLAIVLIGTSLASVAGYGAAGALGLLGGDQSPSPSLATPSPEPSRSPGASESLEPSESPDASESLEPSESPDASESLEPSESPGVEPSDDSVGSGTPSAAPSGAGTGPVASDDSGGSSPAPSADDRSPKPSDTPRPSDTPHP